MSFKVFLYFLIITNVYAYYQECDYGEIKSYEIVECAKGASYKDAINSALDEIAKKIYGVNVNSSSVKMLYRDDDVVVDRYKYSNEVKTDIRLFGGYEVVRKYRIDDSNYFVMVKYLNLTLKQKVKKLLSKGKCDGNLSPFFKNSDVFEGVNGDIDIIHKDGIYQLSCGDYLIAVENINKLFYTHKSTPITLTANKALYKNNEVIEFFIDIKKSGYVTIFNVDSKGVVSVVISNKRADKSFTYPSKDSDYELIVDGEYVDMFISILSKDKVNLNTFESVSNSRLDKTNYLFKKMVNLIGNNYYSSYVIKIKS